MKMTINITISLLILLLFTSCTPFKSDKALSSKLIVGNFEYIYIPSKKLRLKAKIDTGATTTSIHALNIKEFRKYGEKWVSFNLKNEKGELLKKTLPLHRFAFIKRHGMKNQKRHVVKLRINLGNISKLVEVTLTNREKFNFPVLIGQNFLKNNAIVDVSKKYIHEPIK